MYSKEIQIYIWASQVLLVVKNPPANSRDVRDVGSIPGSGRSPGGGLGNPPQYSCLGNPTDRGAWQVTVHRLVNRQKQPKVLSTHAHLYINIYILYILFQILFHYKLLQGIKYNFLCYTIGSCLSVLHIVICICYSQAPNLSLLLPFPFGNHKFSMSLSLFLFCKWVHLYQYFFRFHI